jgi:hypothetical protein
VTNQKPHAKPAPRLDPANGEFWVEDYVVGEHTTLASLHNSPYKISGERFRQEYKGHQIDAAFAKASVPQADYEFQLGLRFDRDLLTKISLSVASPRFNAKDWDEYFEKDFPEIERLLAAWLRKQVGETEFSQAAFPWGSVALGSDKSENLFIVINYNTWDRLYEQKASKKMTKKNKVKNKKKSNAS